MGYCAIRLEMVSTSYAVVMAPGHQLATNLNGLRKTWGRDDGGGGGGGGGGVGGGWGDRWEGCFLGRELRGGDLDYFLGTKYALLSQLGAVVGDIIIVTEVCRIGQMEWNQRRGVGDGGWGLLWRCGGGEIFFLGCGWCCRGC